LKIDDCSWMWSWRRLRSEGKKMKKEKIKLVLAVHRCIQETCNLITEIIYEILDIKKLTEIINLTDGSIYMGPKRKNLELWDQNENNK